jgi:bis(5'-nucleosyl)-tetraphosphatase (symmetrical)
MNSMSLYCIGDLQGCSAPFQRLLEKVDFSPSRDTLYLLGDLVNRGPDSLGVLRSLTVLGDAAQCLLGNHDLHLLALWQGVRKPGRHDTVQDVLQAPDREALLDWLRHRAMAVQRHGWLMVHAGVLPQWSTAQTLSLAAEVEQALRGPDLNGFLSAMYGNKPCQWRDDLKGADRLRVIVNALTRLRFCTAQGAMEFSSTESASAFPEGYMPWFEVPGRATQGTPMAFGHWSTLATDARQHSGLRNNTLPLDTGCVWGGCLSAARLEAGAGRYELIQVSCEQAQIPGK